MEMAPGVEAVEVKSSHARRDKFHRSTRKVKMKANRQFPDCLQVVKSRLASRDDEQPARNIKSQEKKKFKISRKSDVAWSFKGPPTDGLAKKCESIWGGEF